MFLTYIFFHLSPVPFIILFIGGQATFQTEYFVTTDDYKGTDTWTKTIDTGSEYVGPVVIELFAPLPYADVNGVLTLSSSVLPCFNALSDYEMGAEVCGQHG